MTPGSLIRVSLLGCWFTVSGVCASTLTEGLIAHYPLDQIEGGEVKDVSGNERTAFGEHIGIVDGLGGTAFAFDGMSSVINLPDDQSFDVVGDYSVSFWMRVEAGSEGIGPIFAQPDFSIASFKGSLRVTFRSPDYLPTGSGDLMGPKVNDGEWHHIVLTYVAESGETMLYMDTVDVARVTFAHKPYVTFPTMVGKSGRAFFQGELSDLRVYSRPLTSAEVVELNDFKLKPSAN